MLEQLDPVIGWRGWRFHTRTNVLHSLVWHTRWPAFERLEAVVVPELHNVDGIHAWTTREHLDRIIKFDPSFIPVWGQVSLWGTVVDHDIGYRAQYAYPYSFLILPGDINHASQLSRCYGVEVLSL